MESPKPRARRATALPIRPIPIIPRRLPQIRWPNIEVGPHPFHRPFETNCSPSTKRRGTARIMAIVMSAVSSVKTVGVLVTVMARLCAASRSILSTPAPKLAINFSRRLGKPSSSSSIRSATVGTKTSAISIAFASSSLHIGVSSSLRRASNNSIIRASMTSGSFRVTTTRGLFAICASQTDG